MLSLTWRMESKLKVYLSMAKHFLSDVMTVFLCSSFV